MAIEQQINRLPGLLVVKMIWQISLSNRLAHQSITSSNKWMIDVLNVLIKQKNIFITP